MGRTPAGTSRTPATVQGKKKKQQIQHDSDEPHITTEEASEGENTCRDDRQQAKKQSRRAHKARRNNRRSSMISTVGLDLQLLGRQLLQAVQAVVDEADLKQAESALPLRHFNEKSALSMFYSSCYHQWRLQLRHGFSLLFHGLGSKLKLLESFAESALTDGGVLAVNGFNPRLTAQQVVIAAASGFWGKSCRSMNPMELLTQLSQESGERSLYLLLHNIDGPGLHTPSDQLLLAELASCRCIHMIASSDHVNAPLLWSQPLSRQFNWLWLHTPTYLPCTTEALDVPSILAGWGAQSQRRGASRVLHSLVPNARHVFRVLAEVLLDDPGCEGLSFAHWFRLCRERFLVSTEQALRGHLTEFRDHELLKTRTNSEGLDVLYIPLDAEALRTMLQELHSME